MTRHCEITGTSSYDCATEKCPHCPAGAEHEGLARAASALLDKLDAIAKATAGTFVMSHIHGVGYSGLNWSEEYNAVRAALSGEREQPARKLQSHALAQKIQPDRTIRIPNSEIFAEPKPIRIKKRHYVRHK